MQTLQQRHLPQHGWHLFLLVHLPGMRQHFTWGSPMSRQKR